MPWVIRGEPRTAPWEEKDTFGWQWEIVRGNEARIVTVRLTGQVRVETEQGRREEARWAIETNGRSAVESVLDQDDPPDTISFTTGGREDQ